jgi:hypothetical protein
LGSIDTAGEFRIGKENADSTSMTGNMDEVRIQADNYFSAAPNSYPAAVIFFDMEGTDEDATTVNDGYGTGTIAFTGTAKLDGAGGASEVKLNATTSLLLDGNSDYVTVTDASGSDYDVAGSATDSWTIDTWVYKTNNTGIQTHLSQFQASTDKWQLVDNAGALQFEASSTAGGTFVDMTAGTSTISTGTWTHLAVVKAGNHWGLYKDGVQGDYDLADATATFTGKLALGIRDPDGTPIRYLAGRLEQVQITKANKFGIVPISYPFTHLALENNTDDGTGANTFTENGSPTYTSGHLNNALTLVATSSQFLNADAMEVDVDSDTTGSFSFWMKPDTESDFSYIFTMSRDTAGSDTYFGLEYLGGASDRISAFLTISGTDSFYVNSTVGSVPDDSTWAHVVVTQDGVAPKIYIDGVEAFTNSTTTNLTHWFADLTSSDTARIGCREKSNSAADKFFDGQIDDFRYYQNYVLTPEQVTCLYNLGTGTEATFADCNFNVPTSVLTQDTITVPTAEYGVPTRIRLSN